MGRGKRREGEIGKTGKEERGFYKEANIFINVIKLLYFKKKSIKS